MTTKITTLHQSPLRHLYSVMVGSQRFLVARRPDSRRNDTFSLFRATPGGKALRFTSLGKVGRAIRLLVALASKKPSTLQVIKEIKATTEKLAVVTLPASITPKTKSIPTKAYRQIIGKSKLYLKSPRWEGDTLHWVGLDGEPCKSTKSAIIRDVAVSLLVIEGDCPDWARKGAARDARRLPDPFETAMAKAREQKARVWVNEKELTMITWGRRYLEFSSPATRQGERMPYTALRASIKNGAARIENIEHLPRDVAKLLGLSEESAKPVKKKVAPVAAKKKKKPLTHEEVWIEAKRKGGVSPIVGTGTAADEKAA